MNIVSKVLILLLAILSVVASIMFYAKTQVEPPTKIEELNQYVDNLQGRIYKDKERSVETSAFNLIVDRVLVLREESKIDKATIQKMLDEYLYTYTQKLSDYSIAKLQNTTWTHNDLYFIENRLSKIESLTSEGSSASIVLSSNDNLKTVNNIILQYHSARSIAKTRVFVSIDKSRAVMSDVKRYKNNSYLRNCNSLVSELEEVGSRIETAHYRYISSKVNVLSQYRSYDRSHYEQNIIPEANKAVLEYDKNANGLYGCATNVEGLWKKARQYYDQAMNHYVPQYSSQTHFP